MADIQSHDELKAALSYTLGAILDIRKDSLMEPGSNNHTDLSKAVSLIEGVMHPELRKPEDIEKKEPCIHPVVNENPGDFTNKCAMCKEQVERVHGGMWVLVSALDSA